jgi:hypothetical protein
MKSDKSNNPSAGSAEPSWFEWETGLLCLVELLDEDSEIASVAFQLYGTKGWDDVGVRLRDGRTRLMQMKHSRTGGRLTFGDLVIGESDSSSLLRSLACAWKAEVDQRGNVECVLATNRSSGSNWYQGRPPLAEFVDKLKIRVATASSIHEVLWNGEDQRYQQAWEIFSAELSDLNSSEILAFLKSFHVRMDAPDLEELESQIRKKLELLTGLPQSSINGLFNALIANLRKWTSQTRREKEWIDREALKACLACDEDAPLWLGHCEVETPEPFFPSRNNVVKELQASVLSNSAYKVDFLSAEPGAGKTSCVSKLARAGAILWKDECVSIRFYAYRPIRPGQRDLTGDFGIGVQPEALWIGLLWQIRDNLRKTRLLAELRVPVWLEDMPWKVARSHVLRIADALGNRWGRAFVICVDGIDHAARAQRKHVPEFLQTLPSPETIPEHVRFLLAGQPADAYPEYPFFLRQKHDAVKVHSIDFLGDEDLRILWRAAKPQLPAQFDEAVIRLIGEKARRRTLPTVYAVEEIRAVSKVADAARALDAHPLADSLHNYYDSIWSGATGNAADEPRLAATFALLRERPTGDLMASAFPQLRKSATEWADILRKLRPLVRETAEGFEMVHNDLRVHLDERLTSEPFARKETASAFADYYRKPESNRLVAHLSLLNLLITAEREIDFADDFTVDWVIEAGAFGVIHDQLAVECSAAFAAAVKRENWLLLHSVACASLTVNRLHDCVSNWSDDQDPFTSNVVPTFLPVEGQPLPLELWNVSDFSELIAACQQFVDTGVQQRAAVVLDQWIGGISIDTLIEHLAASEKTGSETHPQREALRRDLEQFGKLSALCQRPLVFTETDSDKNSPYRAAFEKGWVLGLAELPSRRAALRAWSLYGPRYVLSWVTAVKAAADHLRWGEVRALLNRMEGCVKHLDANDRITLGWFASRARPKNADLWRQPLKLPKYGLPELSAPLSALRMVAQWLAYDDPNREPTQIATDLAPYLDQRHFDSEHLTSVGLVLCTSAICGRILRYLDQNNPDRAVTSVRPKTLEQLMDAIWCCRPTLQAMPHDEFRTPGEVGMLLANTAWNCHPAYRQVLCNLAKARFADVMLWDEGMRVFDMLLETGERAFLIQMVTAKAREVIEQLHEEDTSSRSVTVANLLHFVRHLKLSELAEELANRFRRTRLGYSSSKEWVFEPLVNWFELVRRSSPKAWRAQGMQLIALDRICEQQNGDNNYSEQVIAEVSAAAMACGADDFEALFEFLATRKAKSPLWDLVKAAHDGFKRCLNDREVTGNESISARIAIAVALGRWPQESAVKTITQLLTGRGVPPELASDSTWQKAFQVAAEIQGVQPNIQIGESSYAPSGAPRETRSAEAILREIAEPKESSWLRLSDIAALAEQARTENHINRDGLIAKALDALGTSGTLSRCLEFHDTGLMSRLHRNLVESEEWRLIKEITAVVGEMRKEVHDPNWVFMVAFSAVDLACRARVKDAERDFTTAAFEQLLAMHWKWHGIAATPVSVAIRNTPSTWPDAARRMLLLLTQTDACETLYMALSGLRFFAEVFPEQIPEICRAGLADERTKDAILALAQLWATRHPHALAPIMTDFIACEGTGVLEDRLDAWIVGALRSMATNNPLEEFKLPAQSKPPELSFPGDGPLFESGAQMEGLMRHNSFAKMANERIRRVRAVLGPMDGAYRYMARIVKSTNMEFPSMILPPPKRLAFDSSSPRQRHKTECIVGDAILYQFAGQTWPPADAAAVRLFMGYGIDPWVASMIPNPWPAKQIWPSDFDVERWIEEGARQTADVGLRLRALLEGNDLNPSLLLLGAILRIPTFRRDLQFEYWLAAPREGDGFKVGEKSVSPSGRTFSGWLPGWSFAAHASIATTVHFVGSLVNYPNGELDITPTNDWSRRWGWEPDPKNCLAFRAKGKTVAWYERWISHDISSRRVWRQPLLSRWVARRDAFPVEEDELSNWARRTDSTSGLLSHPE